MDDARDLALRDHQVAAAERAGPVGGVGPQHVQDAFGHRPVAAHAIHECGIKPRRAGTQGGAHARVRRRSRARSVGVPAKLPGVSVPHRLCDVRRGGLRRARCASVPACGCVAPPARSPRPCSRRCAPRRSSPRARRCDPAARVRVATPAASRRGGAHAVPAALRLGRKLLVREQRRRRALLRARRGPCTGSARCATRRRDRRRRRARRRRPTRACRRRSRSASSRARTLEVALEPPDAATASTPSASGCARRRRERIYGLTERLRDSPPLAPGVDRQSRSTTSQPPEVGSLDRRGETVEMRILPTFSLYAPFYQSSRGYGLAVAGTTFGRLRPRARPIRAPSRFRFETGTTRRRAAGSSSTSSSVPTTRRSSTSTPR